MAELISGHLDVACWTTYFPANALMFPCPGDREGKMWEGGVENDGCLSHPSTVP